MRQEVIPHHIQRNGRHAAGLRAKPVARCFDFRQIIGHDIDAPVHKNTVDNVGRVVRLGIAANEICQKIAGQGTVGEMG
jgi:hypothetical protein